MPAASFSSRASEGPLNWSSLTSLDTLYQLRDPLTVFAVRDDNACCLTETRAIETRVPHIFRHCRRVSGCSSGRLGRTFTPRRPRRLGWHAPGFHQPEVYAHA